MKPSPVCLRDMVRNHQFQLLRMVGMEPPNSFAAEDVRTERARLIQAAQPVKIAEVVRGRYAAGREMIDAAQRGAEPELCAAGSQGPKGADGLLARNGRHGLSLCD